MPAATSTPSPTIEEEEFLSELEVALQDAFGISFRLWVRNPRWTPCGSRASGPDDAGPLADASRFSGLFEKVLAEPNTPFVNARPNGEYMVLIPIPRPGEDPIVAVGQLSTSGEELLRGLGALAVKAFHQRRSLAESRLEIDGCARLVSKSLDKITYLHELASQLESYDISHSMTDVAEAILPKLRELIQAEAVVLVSAGDRSGDPEGQAAQVGSPAIWVGARVIDDETCAKLLDRFQEASASETIVVNRFAKRPESADFPGVEGFVLASVAKDDSCRGWLLALNRRAPKGSGPDQPGYPEWGLSDFEFGSAEAELARATALSLAMYANNAEQLQSMRQAKDRAEAASRARSDLLAGVSHELGARLRAVLDRTDLLIDEADERLPCEELEMIKRDAERMLHVLGRLADLSKTMAGEIERVPCSPKELVDDVESQLRAYAEEKGLRLRVKHVEPIPETIRTDPMRLKEVLLNLVRNAIKFTERGSVRMVTRSSMDNRTGPIVTFMVIDTGVGMTEEQAAGLFQPSVPVDGSATGGEGATGLGFAINKRLIELLGGELSISTAAGAGSVFRVDLPVGLPQGSPMTDRP